MFKMNGVFDILGAKVGFVLVGVDVFDSQFLILPGVSNEMMARVNVLGPLARLPVPNKLKCSVVVVEEKSWSALEIHFDEDILDKKQDLGGKR